MGFGFFKMGSRPNLTLLKRAGSYRSNLHLRLKSGLCHPLRSPHLKIDFFEQHRYRRFHQNKHRKICTLKAN
ncbi:hypothetical protein C1H46_001998 [Malus baccata]|uniref:Uncharacterized protein n=1 Tax=Malus baccata TaxID=106549 RepID=A0A540NMU8_MALBA|nr:hypothetical protein C1H46_001998 [Malus baccata]